MASKEQETFSDLEKSLLKDGPGYSFFQAIRLIRLILKQREECGVKAAASLEGRFLRIRPELTLGFPSADIAGIKAVPLEDGEQRFVVNTTFLGLYGTSSPLPSFYTEDLLREAGDDKSVTRDFLDIVNSTVYPLFVRSLLKYNLFLQINEEKNHEYLKRLYCLMGLGDSSDRSPTEEEARRSLLRYAGLMSQRPRSALGLKTMLSDSLQGIAVNIRQCIPQMVPVPADQRNSLGITNATLGEDMYMGSEIGDCMGRFRIIVGPVPAEQFSACLPGGSVLNRASFLVDHYLNSPLEYDFEVLFDRSDVPSISLGESSGALLGMNSWLGSDCSDGFATIRCEARASASYHH
ncbi:MAG: type VI secretion system baseplate subunit TssG [Desulfobulbus sp.]